MQNDDIHEQLRRALSDEQEPPLVTRGIYMPVTSGERQWWLELLPPEEDYQLARLSRFYTLRYQPRRTDPYFQAVPLDRLEGRDLSKTVRELFHHGYKFLQDLDLPVLLPAREQWLAGEPAWQALVIEMHRREHYIRDSKILYFLLFSMPRLVPQFKPQLGLGNLSRLFGNADVQKPAYRRRHRGISFPDEE